MATEITIPIPDQHVSRVLDAISGLADMNIELMVHGSGFHGDWQYSYEPKQPGETSKQFAERAIKEGIRALVRLWDYAEDRERYRAEVATITPATQDVPDEIIS